MGNNIDKEYSKAGWAFFLMAITTILSGSPIPIVIWLVWVAYKVLTDIID